MEARSISLGPTNLQVSRLGVGVWCWGDRLYWGYGRSYTEDDVRRAFVASIKAGITLFDTAELYGFGRSERLLGTFIAEEGVHDRVVVATKYLPLPWRLRHGDLTRALRRSLRRLGMNQVGLYQVHSPIPPVRIAAWADGLADAFQEGLVRAVGVSNYSVDQMLRTQDALTRRGVQLASNQVAYSLLQRQPERAGVLEKCREMGVTLIAYSPLAEGLLTGKYTPERRPPGYRGWRLRRDVVRVQPLIRILARIGESHDGATSGQVALNWLMRKGAVPIPGAKSADQATENAGALGWELTEAEMTALDAASESLGS